MRTTLSTGITVALVTALVVVFNLQRVSTSAADGPVGQTPVNVILIVMDDVGVDQVGVYEAGYKDSPGADEHPTPCTPHLDDMAANGIRFTNAWSSPVCTPTRSQIMTGMPTSMSGMGIVTNPQKPFIFGLDEDILTIGDCVTNDGAFGKWHLADETQGPSHPFNVGFAEFRGTRFNLRDPPQDGPSYVNWRQWNGVDCFPADMIGAENYATAITTNDALDFLDRFQTGGDGEPWFLYVAYHAAHGPFECPPGSQCPDPGSACEMNWCADCDNPADPDSVKSRAMVQSMDHHIGRIIDRVDFDDTAVIVIGDNGTPAGVTALPFNRRHAKGTMYQGGINVPLIIRAPNQQQPYVCNALVNATDLFATVRSFLQATSEPQTPGVDSYSLRPYVDTGNYTHISRPYAFSESFSPNFRPGPNGELPEGYLAKRHRRAVRNEKYKLIEIVIHGSAEYELFRLYRPDLEGTVPLPHDPAILDDDPEGPEKPDPLNSAFEGENLYLRVPEWYEEKEIQLAFNELQTVLTTDYRPLPVGEKATAPAVLVRTATETSFAPPPQQRTIGYVCSDDEIKVGVEAIQHGSGVHRAFLEFDVSGLEYAIDSEDHIKSAVLAVAVKVGGAIAETELEAWPMIGNVSDYDFQTMSGCEDLFRSANVAGTVYGASGKWVDGVDICPAMEKTFVLKDFKVDLYEAIVGNHKFSVALKLPVENTLPRDVVELFDMSEITAYDTYELRIYYTGFAQGDQPAPDGDMKLATSTPGGPSNRLGQSYPNPFNPTTTIHYAVNKRALVSLRVYDVEGKLVTTLVSEVQDAGDHYSVVWDGRNSAGNAVASGVYFYRLIAGSFSDTKKMILMK